MIMKGLIDVKKNINKFRKNGSLGNRELGDFEKSEKLKRVYLICAGVIVFTLIFCAVFTYNVAIMYRNLNQDELVSHVEIGSNVVERTFENSGQLLSSIANSYSLKSVISDAFIFDSVKSLASSEMFDNVYYIDTEGKKYKSSKTIEKVNVNKEMEGVDLDAQYTILTVEGDFEARLNSSFDEEITPTSGDDAYRVVAPVYVNQMLIGYLVAEKDNSSLISDVTNMTASSITDVYLIDSTGTIISGRNHNAPDEGQTGNFYAILRERLKNPKDGNYVEFQLKQGIDSGKAGYIKIDSVQGESGIFYSSVADSNGCALVYAVPIMGLMFLQKRLIIGSIIFNLMLISALIIAIRIIVKYIAKSQWEIEKLAYEDSMTGAPNENYFKKQASKILESNPDIPYCIMSFDILNFRYVNEAYGHQKADYVLIALANACQETFAYNEAYARIGADRFVALAVADDRTEARSVFLDEKMKKAMGDVLMNFPIRIKRGFYYIKDPGEDISVMMDKASLARKAVDPMSKILVNEYKEDLMDETRRIELIESKMETALSGGEFVPFLQPKWDMMEDHIYGSEALVRWRKNDGSLIPPGEFVPIFEQNGFIEKLDFYILEEVCKYLRRMLDENREVYPVSINQSRYLLYNPMYTKRIQDIIMKYKIPKGLIELEITETVFFQDQEHMNAVVAELKELNLDISIDDFGSGYSSLNLLRQISFDVLKIDRGFIDETAGSETTKLILRKIVEMAHGLGVKVLCEGVETREQADMLLDIECRYVQGFLYSRPIPLEEFIGKYNLVKS